MENGYNTIGRGNSMFQFFDINLLKRIREANRVKLDKMINLQPGKYTVQNGYVYRK